MHEELWRRRGADSRRYVLYDANGGSGEQTPASLIEMLLIYLSFRLFEFCLESIQLNAAWPFSIMSYGWMDSGIDRFRGFCSVESNFGFSFLFKSIDGEPYPRARSLEWSDTERRVRSRVRRSSAGVTQSSLCCAETITRWRLRASNVNYTYTLRSVYCRFRCHREVYAKLTTSS